MAPPVRFAIMLFVTAGLQGSAAVDPAEEPSPFEVSLGSVAGFFPSGHQLILDKAKHELAGSEALLMSLLKVVPGSDGDHFSAPAVRFALHKHFVRQYGWHFKGLEPAGAAWNSSSPMQAKIFGMLPGGVVSLFESRFKDGGLLGREVAVLAATLEMLVHIEARARLDGVLAMLHITPQHVMTYHETAKVRDWYMTSFMTGKNPATTTRLDLKKDVAEMPNVFPSWPVIERNFDEIAKNLSNHGREANFFDVVEEVGHSFGPWENTLCSKLKKSLLQLNDDGSGRVDLRDFYYAGLHGKWEFTESVEYLNSLGALDMSNPSSPRVIIPNYLFSPNNCLVTSETHDVCCISECEPLLARLEREIGAPSALPERILEVVANLASSTTPAGRQLPDLLVSRLQAVAAENGGVVPLTGRLFAQWLHHAYPRECPYPHVAGKTAPVNLEMFEAALGKSSYAEISEMKRLASRPSRLSGPVLDAPWEQKEELLAEVPYNHHTAPVGAAFIHMAVALATSGVAALGVGRSVVRAARAVRGGEAAKASECEPSLAV